MREKIKAIKLKFRQSMNGVVAQNMRERGVNYKVNFGLTLPLLKRIAQETGRDAELATLLWEDTAVRESMMLAPLLYPAETLTPEKADSWVATMPTTEVADMCSKYLFGLTPFALEKSAQWAQSDNSLTAYTGLKTATAWLIDHPETELTSTLKAIILTAIEKSTSENKGIAFASSVFLKQAVHHDTLAMYILEENNSLSGNLLSLLTEERALFLEFSGNYSL